MGDSIDRYLASALRRAADDISMASPGQANATLNRVAYSIGQLVRPGGLAMEEAQSVLRVAARARKIPAGEAKDTIKRGLKDGARKPRDLSHIKRSGKLAGIRPKARVVWEPNPAALLAALGDEPTEDEAKKLANAKAILASCVDASNSLAERYWRETRLIPGALPESLYFCPNCPTGDGSRKNETFPAAVLAVRKREGDLAGIVRVYLDEAGQKAKGTKKQNLGRTKGAGVWFGFPSAAHTIIEGEGCETVGSCVASAPDGWAGVATLGSGSYGNVPLPQGIRYVTLLGERHPVTDNIDEGCMKPVVRGAARRADQGLVVRVAWPSEGCKDFNDLLKQKGPDAVRQALLSAI